MKVYIRCAVIATFALLCNGCLTFVTYYSVPQEQIRSPIDLGPPETYEVQKYDAGSTRRIGHKATTWWGSFRVYTTDSPAEYSAVRETSEEFPQPFNIAHVQQAPYLVSPSGIVADLSGVKWRCPVWEKRKNQLGFLLFDPPNAEKPSVSIRYVGTGIEFKIERSRNTQVYHCDCYQTAGVFRLSGSPTASASPGESESAWQPLPISHFPESFILAVNRGPAYVSAPDPALSTRSGTLIVHPEAYRNVRFFDKGLLLLLPFTVAIDIVTAPLSIPLLFMSLEGMRRMH